MANTRVYCPLNADRISLNTRHNCLEFLLFTARRSARITSAVLATAIPSVRLSVCHTTDCVKTTARSTVQFAPSYSKMCLCRNQQEGQHPLIGQRATNLRLWPTSEPNAGL